jgi:hypothetical protein
VIKLLPRLDQNERSATPVERALPARWSGWAACPELFDEQGGEWGPERGELSELVVGRRVCGGARTTLNAHYAQPELAQAGRDLAERLGFAGVFVGLAPEAGPPH